MSLWFVSALLISLALWFLLKPLLAKRDGDETPSGAGVEPLADRLAELERERTAGLVGEAEYAQAQRETEAAYEVFAADRTARAARDTSRTPVAAAVVVVATTIAAAVSYFYLSDGYRMLLAQKHATAMAEDFAAARAALGQRLEERPDDTEARLLLAASNYLAGDYAAAADEYRRADEFGALEDAGAWTQYADALLRSGGAARGGRALTALDGIPASDPEHQRALLFAGLLRFERGEYDRAIERWQNLLALVPADATESRQELQKLIAKAQSEAASSPQSSDQQLDNSSPDKTADPEAPAITVTVSLAAALQKSAAPGDTVFVYARALDGPPLPLSIARLTVADLPTEVRLDEGGAMAPGMSLAEFAQVEVVARVSKQGRAAPAAGDLVGTAAPVNVGDAVAIEISDVIKQ